MAGGKRKGWNSKVALAITLHRGINAPYRGGALGRRVAALGLGFVSAVFDNIPLTALALKQGGYDWGMLAYAVGFGGSMIWFGSSAGVALSNMYPEAKSVGRWLRHGWHVAVGYVLGFFVLLLVLGWHPQEKRVRGASPAAAQQSAPAPQLIPR